MTNSCYSTQKAHIFFLHYDIGVLVLTTLCWHCPFFPPLVSGGLVCPFTWRTHQQTDFHISSIFHISKDSTNELYVNGMPKPYRHRSFLLVLRDFAGCRFSGLSNFCMWQNHGERERQRAHFLSGYSWQCNLTTQQLRTVYLILQMGLQWSTEQLAPAHTRSPTCPLQKTRLIPNL